MWMDGSMFGVVLWTVKICFTKLTDIISNDRTATDSVFKYPLQQEKSKDDAIFVEATESVKGSQKISEAEGMERMTAGEERPLIDASGVCAYMRYIEETE